MRRDRKRKEKTQGMDLEQFLNMPLKDKMQWLIQYYGVAAVVCVIAVGVVINLLHSFLFPAPRPGRQVVILADVIATSDAALYQEELTELAGEDVLVEHFFVSDVYGKASFSAVMGVDPVDIVIAPLEEMRAMEDAEAIREKHKTAAEDLYLAVTVNAVQDEVLDKMVTYLDEKLSS